MRILLLVSFAVTTALASTQAFAQDNERRFRINRGNDGPSIGASSAAPKRGFAPVIRKSDFSSGPVRPRIFSTPFPKSAEAGSRPKFAPPTRPPKPVFSAPFPKTADAGPSGRPGSPRPRIAQFAPPKTVDPRPQPSAGVGRPARQIEVSQQDAAPAIAAPPSPKPPLQIQAAPPPPKPIADPVPAAPPALQAQATPDPAPAAPVAAPISEAPAPAAAPPAQLAATEPAPAVAAPPAQAPVVQAPEVTGTTAAEAVPPVQAEAPVVPAPKAVQSVPAKRKKIVRYYEDADYEDYEGYGYASDEGYGYGGYSTGYGNGGACD
jgi:hypothetical protein